jgi:hypothetical protein
MPLVLAVTTSMMALGAVAQTPKHSFAIVSGEGPVVTDDDIVEYRFAEHVLRVRGESLVRLARMVPPVSGTPFDVVVDGERIYSGRFVPLISSRTFKEPTVWGSVDTNRSTATVVICGPSFGEPQFQTGTDPRIDTRVSRALAALGKLTAGVPGGASDDGAFTHRVREVLTECEKLTPGTTRAEFLEVFEGEGGVSSATHRTFVHRSCPYIKVDAEFALSKPTQAAGEPCPTDPISRISKPYLARSIFDFADDSTNLQSRLVRDIRARLPAGWSCSVYPSSDVKALPHGLERPVFQVVTANTNLSFVKSDVPRLVMQSPVIPLYFYQHSKKADIMKIIRKESNYSWSIPIYFGETDDFVVVTSPAFVNGGVFTPEARHALRPMWKALRELIPNKEKTGVDELAADK